MCVCKGKNSWRDSWHKKQRFFGKKIWKFFFKMSKNKIGDSILYTFYILITYSGKEFCSDYEKSTYKPWKKLQKPVLF